MKHLVFVLCLLTISIHGTGQIAKVERLGDISEFHYPDNFRVEDSGNFNYHTETTIYQSSDEGENWSSVDLPSWFSLGSFPYKGKRAELANGELILHSESSQEEFILYRNNSSEWEAALFEGDSIYTQGPWIIENEVFVIREHKLFAFDGVSKTSTMLIEFDDCFCSYEVYPQPSGILITQNDNYTLLDKDKVIVEEGTVAGVVGGLNALRYPDRDFLLKIEQYFDLTYRWSTKVEVSFDQGQSHTTLYNMPGEALREIGVSDDKIYFRKFQDKSEAWSSGHDNAKLLSIDVRAGEIVTAYDGKNQEVYYDSFLAQGNLYFNNGGAIIKYVGGDFDQREVNLGNSGGVRTNVKKIKASPSGILYAMTNTFLYSSANKGRTWTMVLDHYAVTDFDIDDQDNLYVIACDQVLHSVDSGATFDTLNNILPSTKEIDWPSEIVSFGAGKLMVKGRGDFYQYPSVNLGCSDCYRHNPYTYYSSRNNGSSWYIDYIVAADWPNATAETVYGEDADIAINSSQYHRSADNMKFAQYGQFSSITKNSLNRHRHLSSLSNVSGLTIDGDLVIGGGLQSAVYQVSNDQGSTFRDLSYAPYGTINRSSRSESIYLIPRSSSDNNLYYLQDYDSPFVPLPVFELVGDELVEVLQTYSIFSDTENEYFLSPYGTFKLLSINKFENQISGTIFLDENINCNNDQEPAVNAVSMIKMEQNGIIVHYPVIDGNYTAYLLPGEWTVTPILANANWNLCQQSHQVTLSSSDNTNLDIGVTADEFCADLTVDVATLRLRRCFDSGYKITVKNGGTLSSANSVLTVEVDSFHLDVSFSVPFTRLSSGLYQIDLGEMTLNDRRDILMEFVVSCEADLGHSHCVTATVIGEQTCEAAREVRSQYQENVGSYDPNDLRLFNEDGYEDTYFDKDEYQYYQIRFQNTGTDTAFDVRLEQSLDERLNLTTLEFLSASHDYSVTIQYDNQMTIRFDDILLPDSTTNQLGSNGVISYRIKPLEAIEYGDHIPGRAAIYFDFNAPINTNQVTARIREHCEFQTTTEVEQEICRSRYGNAESGRYRYILNSSDGCDSIIFNNVTVLESYHVEKSVVLCDSETYDGVQYNNPNLNDSYFTSKTIREEAINGCDSIIYLNIEVKPNWQTNSEAVTICAGESYQGHTNSGQYYADDPEQCLITHLTVLPDLNETSDVTICAGMTYEGHSTSGIYTETVMDGNCEGVITLNLTVLEELTAELSIDICAGETYEGYTESGIHQDVFLSENGCDSTRIIYLEVFEQFETSLDVSLCEGEDFEGYDISGIFIDSLMTSTGCDSIRTLNLEVFPDSEVELNETICEGEDFLGYETTGTFEIKMENQFGCDSIIDLKLTVNPSFYQDTLVELCPGENYNGFSETGFYEEYFISLQGCDSIISTQLLVLEENDPDCEVSQVDEAGSSPIEIFPNPTIAGFNILIHGSSSAIVKIYSLEGHEIIPEETPSSTGIWIDLSSFPSGVYLVHTQDEQGLHLAKVIKQ